MEESRTLSIAEFGFLVRGHRETKRLSQDALAKKVARGTNRSRISYLENGQRVPPPEILKGICKTIGLPPQVFEPYLSTQINQRLGFEALLSELTGSRITSSGLDTSVIKVIEDEIETLFSANYATDNALEQLNSIVVFYGVKPVGKAFFDRYLKEHLSSLEQFELGIQVFQKDAIRLFSSLYQAYLRLNTSDSDALAKMLEPIVPVSVDHYKERTEWLKIQTINNQDLPNLGYIAARRIRQETQELTDLSSFLTEIAQRIKENKFNPAEYGTARKRKMDSLLRKYNSKIEHGLFSTLFNPDVKLLEEEAARFSPDNDDKIAKVEETQTKAYSNLANYLTADYLDVYVATSMRSDADFVSVNDFVEELFLNEALRNLKLRYFNPTQSWIDDRVAKGLVEALMLKRADLCIYMAQKEDTFGKDSEASVTLGQGKPVIVYVPKLRDDTSGIDTAEIGTLTRTELVDRIRGLAPEEVIDDAEDNEALQSRLLTIYFDKLDLGACSRIVRDHWSDFDIETEIDRRVIAGPGQKASWKAREKARNEMKKWLKATIVGESTVPLDKEYVHLLKSILVATSIQYEKRATIFKEVHPLALQVILSTGVLNGILVVRSVQECARLVRQLLENSLDLQLISDDNNYKLVERRTKSTIRVISKHKLISNSFRTFYK